MNTTNNVQSVIHVLLKGDFVSSKDVSEKILEIEGKDVPPQSVSSILSKLGKSSKSPFGTLLLKKKKGGTFFYKLKKEALELTDAQAYGLSLKRGPEKFDSVYDEDTPAVFADFEKVHQTQKMKISYCSNSALDLGINGR